MGLEWLIGRNCNLIQIVSTLCSRFTTPKFTLVTSTFLHKGPIEVNIHCFRQWRWSTNWNRGGQVLWTGQWVNTYVFNGPLLLRKIAGCACAGNAGNVFPAIVGMRSRHASRHVPWCMPGSLTSGFLWSRWRGKRSRHSRRMRNPQFYYLERGPCTERYIFIFYRFSTLRWRRLLKSELMEDKDPCVLPTLSRAWLPMAWRR